MVENVAPHAARAEALPLDPTTRWSGAHRVEVGEQLELALGPLSLVLARHPMEWRVRHSHGDDVHTDALSVNIGPLDKDATADSRVVLSESTDSVVLSPVLADRPIIVSPDIPVQLLAGDTVEFFVGTPLWLRVTDAAGRDVLDVPTYPLGDTWFGPLTDEGQLCYAARSNARVTVDDVPVRASRVVTRVRVRNRGLDRFVLQRIALPTPSLSLHRDASGRLWTPTAEITRSPTDDGTQLDEVEVSSVPDGVDTEPVAPARVPLQGRSLLRKLARVFGEA